jgi:hypothetical protein
MLTSSGRLSKFLAQVLTLSGVYSFTCGPFHPRSVHLESSNSRAKTESLIEHKVARVVIIIDIELTLSEMISFASLDANFLNE